MIELQRLRAGIPASQEMVGAAILMPQGIKTFRAPKMHPGFSSALWNLAAVHRPLHATRNAPTIRPGLHELAARDIPFMSRRTRCWLTKPRTRFEPLQVAFAMWHRQASSLITASLSAKMSSEASWRETLALGVTCSADKPHFTDLSDSSFVLSLDCFSQCLLRDRSLGDRAWSQEESNTSMKKTQGSSAGSEERSSDSVELHETAFCFLHIQLI